MASVPLNGLTITRGKEHLSVYRFNTRTATHYFCNLCGIYTHHQMRSDPEKYGFNVACLHNTDISNLGVIPTSDGLNHVSDRPAKNAVKEKANTMPLTREFRETVMELCQNPEYRKALLLEALESYLEGDVAVGNSILRDYLNATQGFAEIAAEMEMKEAGLRRMVSNKGNATARNLFSLFKLCQRREGINTAEELFRLAG